MKALDVSSCLEGWCKKRGCEKHPCFGKGDLGWEDLGHVHSIPVKNTQSEEFWQHLQRKEQAHRKAIVLRLSHSGFGNQEGWKEEVSRLTPLSWLFPRKGQRRPQGPEDLSTPMKTRIFFFSFNYLADFCTPAFHTSQKLCAPPQPFLKTHTVSAPTLSLSTLQLLIFDCSMPAVPLPTGTQICTLFWVLFTWNTSHTGSPPQPRRPGITVAWMLLVKSSSPLTLF